MFEVHSIWMHINFYLLEMTITTDEVLEQIGSFGRYQIVLNIFFNLAYALWWAVPVMISVFIASEPGWQCKNTSTCPYTDTISLGDTRFKYRCNIPREDWKFANDFTSIVTEVNTRNWIYHPKKLANLIWSPSSIRCWLPNEILNSFCVKATLHQMKAWKN